jgi:hypothetical protein
MQAGSPFDVMKTHSCDRVADAASRQHALECLTRDLPTVDRDNYEVSLCFALTYHTTRFGFQIKPPLAS